MTSCSAASNVVPPQLCTGALMFVPVSQSDLAGGTGPTEQFRCSALIPNPCTLFFSSTSPHSGGCCNYGLKLFNALFFFLSVVLICLFFPFLLFCLVLFVYFQAKQFIVYVTPLLNRSLQTKQGSRSHPGSGMWPFQKHEGQGSSHVCTCCTQATQTHSVPVVTSVCRA